VVLWYAVPLVFSTVSTVTTRSAGSYGPYTLAGGPATTLSCNHARLGVPGAATNFIAARATAATPSRRDGADALQVQLVGAADYLAAANRLRLLSDTRRRCPP